METMTEEKGRDGVAEAWGISYWPSHWEDDDADIFRQSRHNHRTMAGEYDGYMFHDEAV